MRKVLSSQFFDRNALEVAPELLGKYLVRFIDGTKIAKKIVEVEAYAGPEDLASHSSRGKTKRTEVMFGEPGRFYVYFIYGMYWMLNVVCGPGEYPSAVLIRGVEDLIGPGKVAKHFKIDKVFNGLKILKENDLWIEDRGEKILPSKIIKSKRVGVDYAGEYKDKEYRFSL